jgi:cytochrome P450
MGSSSHVREELNYLPKGEGVRHRDPRYWPTKPSKTRDDAYDLNNLRPERWLVKIASDGTQLVDSETESDDDQEFGGFAGQDTSAQLFRPTRGSYLPFSNGPGSFLGRRLARIKAMAVLSVIFQQYSMELVVDE